MKIHTCQEVDVITRSEFEALAARVELLESRPSPEPDPEPPSLGVNTIWFDDFEAPEDVGWQSIRTPVPRMDNAPSRWQSYVATGADYFFEAGAGRNGSTAYKVAMDYPRVQLETGRMGIEFLEHTHIHIRTWAKLSDGFVWGTNQPVASLFWKWWRLHQSPWTRGNVCPYGVNGEWNTNFIIGHMDGPFLCHTAAYRTQPATSPSPQIVYKTRDVATRMPLGDYDPTTCAFTNTRWVQVDASYRLGDMDADNGSIDCWIDGVKQPTYTPIPVYGATAPITGTGLATNPRSHDGHPAGFNVFSFLDNYSNLTIQWDRQHYVYIDSIYIYDGIPNDLPR